MPASWELAVRYLAASVVSEQQPERPRVTDEFMQAVIDDTIAPACLGWRSLRSPQARRSGDLICECAWETGDPGLQYDTTINKRHTIAQSGRIVSLKTHVRSFLHHNDTACNPHRLNLLKFRTTDGFDYNLCFGIARLSSSRRRSSAISPATRRLRSQRTASAFGRWA